MVDQRDVKLAKVLVEHATKVKKGDAVVISGDIVAESLIKEVYKLCLKKGAFPSIHVALPGMSKLFFDNASESQLTRIPEVTMFESKKSDVFIGIHGTSNTREMSGINPSKLSKRSKVLRPISEVRMNKRWVICDYPTNALAMEGDMGLDEYTDWFYGACNIDYSALEKRYKKLQAIVSKGKTLRIVGKNTDIKFGIENMLAINTQGKCNIPDGEVFTAPEKNKVEGYVEFSYPAIRAGQEVDGIRLEFKKGKIVKATATKNEKFLKTMINMDAGSSYLGEIGIGINYNISKYTKNLLFDEKIGGTIHLAIGMAYPECCIKNKTQQNKSALHWDIVKDLRKQAGGGEIWVDNKLVQKNGKFLV